jgi:hypothetical protein
MYALKEGDTVRINDPRLEHLDSGIVNLISLNRRNIHLEDGRLFTLRKNGFYSKYGQKMYHFTLEFTDGQVVTAERVKP